ncbi:MAG: hypothetical protein GY913_11885 [Proteobacteria bacterium]|nr:hypothetical protein [Pseudomonadota bacterium]MCP4917615.1 hypothetical protein [Pseudomonadota bacterium]
MIWLLACSKPCPEGVADTERLLLLREIEPSLGHVCFSDRSGLIGDTVVLDSSQPDPDLAARARHLELHRQGQPTPGPSCEAQWLEMEVVGWRTELQRRHVYGLEPTLPFEATWRVERDEEVIRTWLVENPHGGDGIDGLMAGYAARCVP